MKQARKWKCYKPTLLKGHTVGVLGLGNIGKEIARLCGVFGMRVMGLCRADRSPLDGVDRVYPRGQLHQFLGEGDFVVLALPLTKATHNLIGERELRSMKARAYLINVARGALVDEGALIHEFFVKTSGDILPASRFCTRWTRNIDRILSPTTTPLMAK